MLGRDSVGVQAPGVLAGVPDEAAGVGLEATEMRDPSRSVEVEAQGTLDAGSRSIGGSARRNARARSRKFK
jgi:hypothetical protein